jgi:beta-lactamase class A
MATLDRRVLLAALPAAVLAACEPGMPTTASSTPRIDVKRLDRTIMAIARKAAPATLGMGLMNLESGQSYLFNSDHRFPLQSVFKLPLGAAVLAEADAGRLSLDEPFDLKAEDLSAPLSPIGAAWPARKVYSARELLEAAVSGSDNTAADVLLKRIGGPGALTAWLAQKHVTDLRVDRYEREIQPATCGMASFRPDWRTPAAFAAARAAVPEPARLAALRAYMADPRDTATPQAMLQFLQALDREELISPASTQLLTRLMAATTRGNGRLRAGLPKDVFLAHRPGTSTVEGGLSAATNDVGIFTLPDRRSYAIAVFLTGSTLDDAGRDDVIARVGRAALEAVG